LRSLKENRPEGKLIMDMRENGDRRKMYLLGR